jgi:uncharacterized delta-60 repeat protein
MFRRDFPARSKRRRNPLQPRQRLRMESLEPRTMMAAGDLDPTFNGAGYAITSVSSSNYDFARDVLVQPSDHKIITVGTSSSTRTLKVGTYVVRHLENGQRDSSFGNNGIVNVTIGSNLSMHNAALQADGKILLAGGNEGDRDFAVVRLNANGTLDKTFGKSGLAKTDMGATIEKIEAIAVAPDGKIVVAGASRVNNENQFALARYNANGSLDTTFGSGGKVLTNLRPGREGIAGIALQGDKILVAGTSSASAGNHPPEFTVARYTSSGALDTNAASGFGPIDPGTGLHAGFVTTLFSGSEGGNAANLAIQSDGKIVAVGQGHNAGSGWDFVVARYDANGAPDLDFSGVGHASVDFTGGTDFDADFGRSVAIQSDGKIVVGGDPAPLGFGLARLNTDGALDTTFGVGGLVVAADGGLRDASEIELQPWDGKLVAVGGAGASKSSFGTARFLTAESGGASASASAMAEASALNDFALLAYMAEDVIRPSSKKPREPLAFVHVEELLAD